MSKAQYVWYASYGSNLSYNRFLCYIRGGSPEEGQEPYRGCVDTTPPRAERSITLQNELYFARRSTRWQRGGIGFIETNINPRISTYGYMYLISRQQFIEIVQQENKDIPVTIDFDETIQNRSSIISEEGAYSNLLFIGNNNNYPIFTFTNQANRQEERRPSEQYLRMISSGLIERYRLSQEEIVSYLITKGGVLGNYNSDQLFAVTAPLFNN